MCWKRVFLFVLCVSLYRWVHFSGAVLFSTVSQQKLYLGVKKIQNIFGACFSLVFTKSAFPRLLLLLLAAAAAADDDDVNMPERKYKTMKLVVKTTSSYLYWFATSSFIPPYTGTSSFIPPYIGTSSFIPPYIGTFRFISPYIGIFRFISPYIDFFLVATCPPFLTYNFVSFV